MEDKQGISGIGDAVTMIVDYLKQETVTPLKGLGRYLGFGLVSAVFLSFGFSMIILAALRALQTETGDTFSGNLSWVPYIIVLVGTIVIASIAASAIGRTKRAMQKSKSRRSNV